MRERTLIGDVAARLTCAAGVKGVLVTVEPGDDINAYAAPDPCTGARMVILDGGLLVGDQARLCGVLAHEVAHHVLGHPNRARWWHTVARCAAYGALLAVAARGHAGVVVSALAVALVAFMVHAARERHEEYAADALSVELLAAAGLPGVASVLAALADAPADPRWYRAGGWLLGSHPLLEARVRRIGGHHAGRDGPSGAGWSCSPRRPWWCSR